MSGGIIDMVMSKIKPIVDAKMDETKKDILTELKNVEAKVDEIKEMLKNG